MGARKPGELGAEHRSYRPGRREAGGETLHGSQPESAGRTYVVIGHLDSRVTDVMNATSDAPGADDDGSGVAAVLELARVMSKHQFDATIIFASRLAEAQTNVAGMFSNDIVADDGPFLDKGYPGLRMTEPNEDYRHEHQTCGSRTVSSSATSSSSSTTSTSRTWRG